MITSSGAGFKSVVPLLRTRSHGAAGYAAAEHGVVGLMRHYATTLAERCAQFAEGVWNRLCRGRHRDRGGDRGDARATAFIRLKLLLAERGGSRVRT